MSQERITLDPPEVVNGRTELPLHDDAILVAETGPEWGDATVEGARADGVRGSVPVDITYPNRTVTIPLLVGDGRTMTFAQARALLQQKAAQCQLDGGFLKRELRDGRKLFLQAVGATLKFGGGSVQALQNFDPDVVLTLETLPDWFGEEVELASGTIGGSDPATLAIPSVPGDYPAQMRAVITGAGDRRSLIFAIRPADPSPTAQMDYAATELTPLGGADIVSGGVEYADLPPTWVAVLSTEVAGTGQMTHVGPHRVWALTTRSAQMQVQLEWKQGSSGTPQQNTSVALAAGASWNDLGEVQIDAAVAGEQQWEGLVLVNAPAGETLTVHRLLVLPVGYGYGYVLAPSGTSAATDVVAWDSFTAQRPGTLDGQASAGGGRWAGTDADGGVTSAMQVGPGASSRGVAYRETNTDATARLTYIDEIADVAAVDVSCLLTLSMTSWSLFTRSECRAGLLARYVDAHNWVAGVIVNSYTQGFFSLSYTLAILKSVGGVVTRIAGSSALGGFLTGLHTVRVAVTSEGIATLTVDGNKVVQSAPDADLAAGGSLAAGAVGFYDYCNGAFTLQRAYDTIFMGSGSSTVQDVVLRDGGSAELSTKGYSRSGADGRTFAPLTVFGELPRLPASGAERRGVELFVRASTALLGQSVDVTEESQPTTITVNGRPSYAFTPE